MRKLWVLTGAVALVAAAATGGVVAKSSATHATSTAQQPPVNTTTVERDKLSAVISQEGTITYSAQADGSPYSLVNQTSGTYTKLPVVGQVISHGKVIYRVSDRPVVLLYGSTPAYRTLSAGATGADVAELNAELVALGYATSAELGSTSAAFGSATSAAVKKLQAVLGVTQTGMLPLGQAVFEPTAMRVAALTVPLGGGAQTGQAVMQATSTTRQVQVALDSSQQAEVVVGDKVTIILPNNTTTPGVVSSVGTVATCPSNSGSGGPSSTSSAAPGTGTCASSGSRSTTPTITMDVTPLDPAATGMWDQAPVQVDITTASVPSALVVPVTALLAQSVGGYAVEVLGSGGTDQLVPVSLGLFDDADGLVQVTGPALAAGQEVVVPAT